MALSIVMTQIAPAILTVILLVYAAIPVSLTMMVIVMMVVAAQILRFVHWVPIVRIVDRVDNRTALSYGVLLFATTVCSIGVLRN